MKMNKLRLTNKIENHFYLDFNWKDEGPVPSVSRQQIPPFRPKTVRDTDDMGHWSVSRRNKEKVWVQAPEGRRDKSREMMDKVKITVVMYQELTKNS